MKRSFLRVLGPAGLAFLVGICALAASDGAPPASPDVLPHGSADDRRLGAPYGEPIHLADLEDQAINESSGLAASRRNPGRFWTHNDSGGGPFLYAFDRSGRACGVWQVTGAKARDWEDMAAGPGPESGRHYLYIADIGDNFRRRREIIVYRVAEPLLETRDASSSRQRPRQTERAEAIRLRYPDGQHDAEAMLVHPTTGDLYIVAKRIGSAAGVYKAEAPLSTVGVILLRRIGEVRGAGFLGGLVTGGAIAPDGRRLVLCSYGNARELVLPDTPGTPFDAIWEQAPLAITLLDREQREAICYRLDGRAVLTTSEGRPAPLDEVALSGSHVPKKDDR